MHMSTQHNVLFFWYHLFSSLIWIYAMSHLSRTELFSNYLIYLELIKKKSSLKARKIVTEVMRMEVQGYQRDSQLSVPVGCKPLPSTGLRAIMMARSMGVTAPHMAVPLWQKGLWSRIWVCSEHGCSWRLHWTCWPLWEMGSGTIGSKTVVGFASEILLGFGGLTLIWLPFL